MLELFYFLTLLLLAFDVLVFFYLKDLREYIEKIRKASFKRDLDILTVLDIKINDLKNEVKK